MVLNKVIKLSLEYFKNETGGNTENTWSSSGVPESVKMGNDTFKCLGFNVADVTTVKIEVFRL